LTGKHCEAAWSMVNSLPLPWNATSQFTTDYVWKAMGKLRKWHDLMIPSGKSPFSMGKSTINYHFQ
jgi:hypothetical protein